MSQHTITLLFEYLPRLPRGRALTNRNSLVAVGPSPSVFAAAAVITAEVSVTLTGTVEETDGPSLPIIPSVVRVLRAVPARVHRHGHALSAPRAGATRVVVESGGRRAALSAPESFGCHALSGELSVHDHRAHKHQKAALPHYPRMVANFFYARLIWSQFYQLNINLQICTSAKPLSKMNVYHFSTSGMTFSVNLVCYKLPLPCARAPASISPQTTEPSTLNTGLAHDYPDFLTPA